MKKSIAMVVLSILTLSYSTLWATTYTCPEVKAGTYPAGSTIDGWKVSITATLTEKTQTHPTNNLCMTGMEPDCYIYCGNDNNSLSLYKSLSREKCTISLPNSFDCNPPAGGPISSGFPP